MLLTRVFPLSKVGDIIDQLRPSDFNEPTTCALCDRVFAKDSLLSYRSSVVLVESLVLPTVHVCVADCVCRLQVRILIL